MKWLDKVVWRHEFNEANYYMFTDSPYVQMYYSLIEM